jgi:hypothetical protein
MGLYNKQIVSCWLMFFQFMLAYLKFTMNETQHTMAKISWCQIYPCLAVAQPIFGYFGLFFA